MYHIRCFHGRVFGVNSCCADSMRFTIMIYPLCSFFQPSCFNNPVVENAVAAKLNDLGVTVKAKAILAEWSLDSESKATELSFLTAEGVFTTSCSVRIISFLLASGNISLAWTLYLILKSWCRLNKENIEINRLVNEWYYILFHCAKIYRLLLNCLPSVHDHTI